MYPYPNGPFGNMMPYTDFHAMNQDWIIQVVRNFLDQYTHIQDVIDEGLDDLEAKKNQLEGLLQAWYNEHSQDIADQLAGALADLNAWYTTHQNYLDATLAANIAAFNQAATAKGDEVIASIPDDYTELAGNVDDLLIDSNHNKVTDTAFPNLNKAVVAVESFEAFGQLLDSSILKTTGFIPVGNCSAIVAQVPCYLNQTDFGFVFYDESKQPMRGYVFNSYGSYETEIRTFNVPKGAAYFRTSGFVNSSEYGDFYYYRVYATPRPFIMVAASNSSLEDQTAADYVCDGSYDEHEIQSAINRTNGEVLLAVGDYYIDSFPNTEGNGVHTALHVGALNQQNISIIGAGNGSGRKYNTGNELRNGVKLHVSTTCYNGLDSSTQYAIIASATNGNNRKYPWSMVNIENISFILPDNQKKIICVDGWMMTSLSIKNILAMAVADASDLSVPVDGCIGIRGLQGSNFGTKNIWSSCFVWGFYEGYAVSGEHVIGMDLGARYCNYGFTFNKAVNQTGGLNHPITMINCCDECNFNMPIFGNRLQSGIAFSRQTIDLIDYNLEWIPEYYALGGDLATEYATGSTYGNITFTLQNSYEAGSGNIVNAPFWTAGHGHNIKTVNKAHSESGTTAERLTYTPQYMQTYYDTTLHKLLIYDGTSWVDSMGNTI